MRLAVRIITVVLVALMVVGVILLIVNRNLGFIDTTYEAIAFTVGMSGMIMAVVSEIGAYNQEKIARKMIRELHELNREADDDEKVDANFQGKLDLLIKQNQEIFRELNLRRKK